MDAVTVLPEPVKSDSDRKNYRLVKLFSGFRVLIISDLHGSRGKGVTDQSLDSDDCDEDVDCEEDGEEGEESSNSESENSFRESDNESVLSIKTSKHEKPKKQAAAALCVDVGSFSDPSNLPGLAHFLEHMVFMGSSKFPDENYFDAFIQRHGGEDNASTDCEKTIFQFEINPDFLKEALLIWAQFFICPLLKQNSVDREVQAVDSEFKMAKIDDTCRREQVVASLCKPNHPTSKFLWGNEKSLKTEPAKLGVQVYRALFDFHKMFYNANAMTLAVQSTESLDTLQAWIVEIFGNCRNNPEAAKPKLQSNVPYPREDLDTFNICHITPVKKLQELHLTWFFPPQKDFYKTKPLKYASWLLAHEGKGSLFSMLKRKQFALSLSVETEEEYSSHASLSVEIVLTEKGYENYLEVLDLTFQYLALLKKTGPIEQIYHEIKTIEDIDFAYDEGITPISNVENICQNMQLYPPEDILSGDSVLLNFDVKVIQDVLDTLIPRNCLVVSYCPIEKMPHPQEEHWFETKYEVIPVEEPYRSKWIKGKCEQPYQHFNMPSPNPYIPEHFDLVQCDDEFVSKAENSLEFPNLLENTSYKLWFKHDREFCLPKAHIKVHLINPYATSSPKHFAFLDILISILDHNMAEVVYDAGAASLSYSIKASCRGGLIISVSGYSDKLSLLLFTILQYLVTFTSSEELFEQHKDHIRRAYFNEILSPKKLCKDIRLSVLEKLRFPLLDKYNASESLQNNGLVCFAKSYIGSFYIEGLVQGNYSKATAVSIFDQIADILKCKCISEIDVPCQRILKVPCKPGIIKIRSFNEEDDNSVITHYLQCGLNDVYHCILMELLSMIMSEPCFNILRTKKQLGYSVYVQDHNTANVLGFSVNVQTQNSKFSVEYIAATMLTFLTYDFRRVLENMSEKDFYANVASLIAIKTNDDNHLGEEVDRNWDEILSQEYNFCRLQEEVECLKQLSLIEFKKFYKEVCLQNLQSVTFQVRGNTHSNISRPKNTDDSAGKLPSVSLEFLDWESEDNDCHGEMIKNLQSFKQQHYFYPTPHTSHSNKV
ncbi:unnamed protein product [Clavelina lepadiformis]|uniref:Nardilysin n=1 Tax=Clavelina lepadiformis TaxID=159417 RepID=A0ABP0GXE1_CLALP